MGLLCRRIDGAISVRNYEESSTLGPCLRWGAFSKVHSVLTGYSWVDELMIVFVLADPNLDVASIVLMAHYVGESHLFDMQNA